MKYILIEKKQSKEITIEEVSEILKDKDIQVSKLLDGTIVEFKFDDKQILLISQIQ